MSKAVVDWGVAERDYRAGMKTLREIGAAHGVSHVAIAKRAKKEKWTRDLLPRIRARAQEKVNRLAVTKKVNKKTDLVSEEEVVEAGAQLHALVTARQRTSLDGSHEAFRDLLAEFKGKRLTPDEIELIAQASATMQALDGEDQAVTEKRRRKLFDALAKSMDLGDRIGNWHKLMQGLNVLINSERVVFSITDGNEDALSWLRAQDPPHAV